MVRREVGYVLGLGFATGEHVDLGSSAESKIRQSHPLQSISERKKRDDSEIF